MKNTSSNAQLGGSSSIDITTTSISNPAITTTTTTTATSSNDIDETGRVNDLLSASNSQLDTQHQQQQQVNLQSADTRSLLDDVDFVHKSECRECLSPGSVSIITLSSDSENEPRDLNDFAPSVHPDATTDLDNNNNGTSSSQQLITSSNNNNNNDDPDQDEEDFFNENQQQTRNVISLSGLNAEKSNGSKGNGHIKKERLSIENGQQQQQNQQQIEQVISDSNSNNDDDDDDDLDRRDNRVVTETQVFKKK